MEKIDLKQRFKELYEAEAEFISRQGYEFSGRHHEIYLSNPRRTAPVKLRTIIRQPVRRSLATGLAGGLP